MEHYGAALAAGEKVDLDDVDGGEDASYDGSLKIVEVVEKDAKSILHANRAACYLKMAQKVWGLEAGQSLQPEGLFDPQKTEVRTCDSRSDELVVIPD